jgi:cyclopropane fatty-acyl-phospholipid synthase-like methyltransferase
MPVTARVARKNIKAAGLQDRIRTISGDFLEDNLGRDRYDAALVSNIVHIYGPDKNLETIKKVHCALRSGGRIIIKDLLVNENRDGPFHPLMFGLTMLMFTDGGDTYTTAEITEWLREAGFIRIRRRAVITHESSMLIADKK